MPVTKDEKSAINQALIKMLRQQGINISESRDLLNELFSDETTEPINLYVETTGKDSNPGTLGAPLGTIQAALDRVPKTIKHPVIINVGVGTFAGFNVQGFSNVTSPKNGAYLNIQGTMQTWTPATGSSSGTATGGTAGVTGSSFGTLVKAGENWTVDDLRGKFVEITGGTGSGQMFAIASNTIDTITIAGVWTAPNATTTFVIRDCGTVITKDIGSYIASPSTSGVAFSETVDSIPKCILVYNNNMASHATGSYSLRFEKLKLLITEAAGVGFSIMNNNDVIAMKYISLTNSSQSGTSYGIDFKSGSGVDIRRSVIDLSQTAASTVYGMSFSNLTTAIGIREVSAFGNGSSGQMFSRTLRVASYTAQLNYIYNLKFGFYFGDSPFNTTIYNSVMDGNNIANSEAFRFTRPVTSPWTIAIVPSGGVSVQGCKISNYINVFNVRSAMVLATNVLSGTGNTTVFLLANGARAEIDAASTVTGSTEITLDGVPYTLADMRAASPKLLTNTYGTIISEFNS